MVKYTKMINDLNSAFVNKHHLDESGMKHFTEKVKWDGSVHIIEMLQLMFDYGFKAGTGNAIDIMRAHVEGFVRVKDGKKKIKER